MRLPVSSIRAQIGHGAGNTIEAKASRIPRHWDRTEAPSQATLRQAYAARAAKQREKLRNWHASCQKWNSGSCLEQALFVFFRAGDAVARPGHCFEALLLEFFLALDARAVAAVPDAQERFIDQLQHGAVGVGLAEQKFLGIGIGSLVGKIHGRIVVGCPAFLFSPRDGLEQFLAPGRQFLLVVF